MARSAFMVGDRVLLCEEHGGEQEITQRGIVQHVSSSGYLRIRWSDGSLGRFSPGGAATALRFEGGVPLDGDGSIASDGVQPFEEP